MDWSILESDSVDLASLRKAAIGWDTCPVGILFPALVERAHGTWDVVKDCPPKLIRLGIQFMDAVDNADREGALRAYRKIANFKV